MRRIVLWTIVLFAALRYDVSTAAVIDLTAKCSNWKFTSNGGAQGSEPTAFLVCKDTPDDASVFLQIICHGHSLSIRYSGTQKFIATERAKRANITYKFKRGVFTDSARFESALGDWVIYRSSMDLQHPIFDAFSESRFVIVKLNNGELEERLPLNNSRDAIDKVMESCSRMGILASLNQASGEK